MRITENFFGADAAAKVLLGYYPFFVVLLVFLGNLGLSAKQHVIFDNPDNHTHDDNCSTCGETFNTGNSAQHPYVRRTGYICRHSSGEMRNTLE